MTSFRRVLLVTLVSAFVAMLSGCTSQTDSSIPWSRPANWEGQVPGMGATQGQGR